MAEIEFSILGRECLDRRIQDKTALINEVNTWTEERNSKESKIIWRFKNEDARIHDDLAGERMQRARLQPGHKRGRFLWRKPFT